MPSFVVRRAQTSIDLKNGQSFMMAGLLQSENNMIDQRIPGLGKLPVLGPLFSSKAYQRRETDLVIIVTPYLVKPIDPSKKPLTPDRRHASGEQRRLLPRQHGGGEGFRRRTCRLTRPGAVAAQVGSGHFLDLPKE